jgi:uncharacterized protein YbcI
MSNGDTPGETASRGQGREILMEAANAMVKAQKEFFGKGPEQAKAYVLDDMLVIVMRGGLTTAELTMLEFGHQDQVRQFRQLFENAMTEQLTGTMEEITGRTISTYQSQIMFDPHTVVEMFVFEEDGHPAAVRATAEGQLADDDTGAATSELREAAAESGQ